MVDEAAMTLLHLWVGTTVLRSGSGGRREGGGEKRLDVE
jgi:hypothetical protein